MQALTLEQALRWLMASGAGIASYWLIERIPALAALASEPKRYVALAMSGGLAMLCFLSLVGLTYEPNPASVQGWLEALFSVAAVACGLNQVVHARINLRARDKARRA